MLSEQNGGLNIMDLSSALKIFLKITSPRNVPVDDIVDIAMAMSYTLKFMVQLKLLISGNTQRLLDNIVIPTPESIFPFATNWEVGWDDETGRMTFDDIREGVMELFSNSAEIRDLCGECIGLANSLSGVVATWVAAFAQGSSGRLFSKVQAKLKQVDTFGPESLNELFMELNVAPHEAHALIDAEALANIIEEMFGKLLGNAVAKHGVGSSGITLANFKNNGVLDRASKIIRENTIDKIAIVTQACTQIVSLFCILAALIELCRSYTPANAGAIEEVEEDGEDDGNEGEGDDMAEQEEEEEENADGYEYDDEAEEEEAEDSV
jgi:hypothetical protein